MFNGFMFQMPSCSICETSENPGALIQTFTLALRAGIGLMTSETFLEPLERLELLEQFEPSRVEPLNG
jgi:hypothetical protein